uniref:Uncharacterized protein n=1 Tax=Plectus sambesii TaxID=2011161 RepID=A0A914XGX7_9BILA
MSSNAAPERPTRSRSPASPSSSTREVDEDDRLATVAAQEIADPVVNVAPSDELCQGGGLADNAGRRDATGTTTATSVTEVEAFVKKSGFYHRNTSHGGIKIPKEKLIGVHEHKLCTLQRFIGKNFSLLNLTLHVLQANTPTESVAEYLHWAIETNANTSYEMTVLRRVAALHLLVKDPMAPRTSCWAAVVARRSREDVHNFAMGLVGRRCSTTSLSQMRWRSVKTTACLKRSTESDDDYSRLRHD